MQRNYTQADFSVRLSKKSITVVHKGETFTVHSGNKRFKKLKKAIKGADWNSVPDLLSPARVIESATKGVFKVVSGQIYCHHNGRKFKLPAELNRAILEYTEEKMPTDSLLAFTLKLKTNPSMHSTRQLYGWIDANGLTITNNGNFIAYKGVTKDYKDCYTEKIDNSVGQRVYMERNEVDDDPNRTCSEGLHVASHNYAHNHYGAGSGKHSRTILVEVDPAKVVAVPNDYNQQKMRVHEYVVVAESKDKVNSSYYGDTADVQSVEVNVADTLPPPDTLPPDAVLSGDDDDIPF